MNRDGNGRQRQRNYDSGSPRELLGHLGDRSHALARSAAMDLFNYDIIWALLHGSQLLYPLKRYERVMLTLGL